MIKKPFLLAASLTALCSCSVFEERGDCPCLLEIVTTTPTSGSILDIAGFENGSRLLFDRFEKESCPARYEREVKRCRMAVVGVLSGSIPNYSFDGRIVSLKRGMQADSLFVGKTDVDASGETASSTVCLHKQFSTVLVLEEREWEARDNYRLEVDGSCAGLDVLTQEAEPGQFYYSTLFSKEGTSFRIPRMSDMSTLRISLYEETTEELYRTFPIGKLMVEAGYDCHAQDLPDVEIRIDLRNLSCFVKVTEWTGEIIVADI